MRFMRYVGDTRCSADGYHSALAHSGNVVIDRLSVRANAAVDFRFEGRPLGLRTDGIALDLLDLSILVYLVDEMVDRSRSSDYWTRCIECVMPVADTNVWTRSEKHLRQALSLLSGDGWSFDWFPLVGSPGLRPHRKRLPAGFDTVCLLSGGTDSLLGAARLLDEGRKLILVGHQAEGQSASAQTAVADGLRDLYPGRSCMVQARVSRSRRSSTQYTLAEKQEISHRPRSFLFLALAVAVANECGISDVFMPENGFMALNIPIQKSRIGSLSTRTAHPAFVLEFHELVRGLGFNVTVRNPFLLKSKTDMLRSLPAALAPIVRRSVSCSKPGRFNDRQVRHCGYCVPCILRRIALMEAGLDSAGDYAFDVFRNLASLDSAKKHDMRALAHFADKVVTASSAELEVLLLSHGYFPPTVGGDIGTEVTSSYAPWRDMIQGWAEDFVAKLRGMPEATRRTVGLTSAAGGGRA